MAIVKRRGNPDLAIFPYRRDIDCAACGCRYQLEPGIDDLIVQEGNRPTGIVGMDGTPLITKVIQVISNCPTCGVAQVQEQEAGVNGHGR